MLAGVDGAIEIVGDGFLARSIIDSEFLGYIEEDVLVSNTRAIRPSISGRARINGKYQSSLDPQDPWPQGYRLSDTWPNTLTNSLSVKQLGNTGRGGSGGD